MSNSKKSVPMAVAISHGMLDFAGSAHGQAINEFYKPKQKKDFGKGRTEQIRILLGGFHFTDWDHLNHKLKQLDIPEIPESERQGLSRPTKQIIISHIFNLNVL